MAPEERYKKWNQMAPIYDFVIRKDAGAFARMYDLMRQDLSCDMRVLELATGTGEVDLHI